MCVVLPICFVLFPENEVDGETLLSLTKNMISRLLPTIRLQVKFKTVMSKLQSAEHTPHHSQCERGSSGNYQSDSR